jgi:hypothetical protein
VSSSAPIQGPDLLTSSHELAAFDCGKPALNAYLLRHALVNQLSGTVRTYVALRGQSTAGYSPQSNPPAQPPEWARAWPDIRSPWLCWPGWQ